MSVTATIFNISRGSFHDGPGVRTVVYLKGCPLSCAWCHNPEGQNPLPELSYIKRKCIGCGRCVLACPNAALTIDAGLVSVDFSKCLACGACVKACPSGALVLLGEEMSPGQLMETLLRDRVYFERSGGGVTFSGGECLLFPDFMCGILGLCRKAGIHTLIETTMEVSFETLCRVLPLCDMVYVDVKLFDSAAHKAQTGRGNERILKNLGAAAALNENITVRVPLIPGVNDSWENLLKTCEFALRCGAKGVEILRYNNLAGGKYEAIGRRMKSFRGEPQSIEVMDALCQGLNSDLEREGYVRHRK